MQTLRAVGKTAQSYAQSPRDVLDIIISNIFDCKIKTKNYEKL